MLLREFTEPAAELLEKYAGLKLDPMWSDAVVGTSLLLFAAFALKGSYLWIRRTFFNDIRALPEDQLAMVNIIAQDVNGIKHDLQRVQESLSASVTTHFDKVVDPSPTAQRKRQRARSCASWWPCACATP